MPPEKGRGDEEKGKENCVWVGIFEVFGASTLSPSLGSPSQLAGSEDRGSFEQSSARGAIWQTRDTGKGLGTLWLTFQTPILQALGLAFGWCEGFVTARSI